MVKMKKTLIAIIYRLGIHIPRKVEIIINMLNSLHFLKHNKGFVRFQTRNEGFNYINQQIGFNPIFYLEFGVYHGRSMREWTRLNIHPVSRFYGFDSFEGLPEQWTKLNGTLDKGYFSTGGKLPEDLVKDNRVEFVKGWFQETLENVQVENDQLPLIIHLDADLYTSTLYALCTLHKHIKKGTLLMFDEFTVGEEYKAFMNYKESYNRTYKVISVAGYGMQHVIIEITN